MRPDRAPGESEREREDVIGSQRVPITAPIIGALDAAKPYNQAVTTGLSYPLNAGPHAHMRSGGEQVSAAHTSP